MAERGLLCIRKCAPPTHITQEIVRVLEALCQELGTDQIYVSSYITVSQIHFVNMTYHCQCYPWSPGWCSVCQVSSQQNYSFLPSILYSLEGNHNTQPTLEEWEVSRNSSTQEICLFSPLIYSVIYISLTHGSLVYTLGYNPILPYVFSCSDCSSFGHWNLLWLALLSLWHNPIIVGLLLLYLLAYSLTL